MKSVYVAVTAVAIAGIAGCASSERSVSEPAVEIQDAGANRRPAKSPCPPGVVCEPKQQYIEPNRL